MAPIDSSVELLQPPSKSEFETRSRQASSYRPLDTYILPKGAAKHYQQQYADMYFARLAQLKPAVESVAADAWANFTMGHERVQRVDRVLDVRQGELCWVVGTIFMDMPLKPNILDDISKDHWIAAPPPREKFITPGAGGDQVMLEDESGRLRLTGDFLSDNLLVTGVIIAVMGTENKNGDFEVIDMKIPDLPRQPQRWETSEADQAVNKKAVKKESQKKSGKIVIVSGLEFTGDEGDTLVLDLLMEYLLGESGSSSDQDSASHITRLIIAGNSLGNSAPIPSRDEVSSKHKAGQKKYGYDSAAYNAAPTTRLDDFLATLLPSIPITILPGEMDPTHTSLPQQPLHPALFNRARAYMPAPDASSNDPEAPWFHSATNPYEAEIDGWRFALSGGQTVDDIYKYVSGSDRLEMMDAMLRWRLMAPTAPDTLWCYPFQDGDRFVLRDCPHVYVVGNQPSFGTEEIEGQLGQSVRLIMVPKFRETGELVVLDQETLEVEVVKFGVFEPDQG